MLCNKKQIIFNTCLQLWKRPNPFVICDGSHDHRNTSCTIFFLHKPDHPCDRYWWTIDLRHEQPLEYYFVEFGLRTSGQKSIQLPKHLLYIYYLIIIQPLHIIICLIYRDQIMYTIIFSIH